MNVLVTGAAGFIGSHLCSRLVAEGHKVAGLDNLSEGSLENLSSVPEVRLIEGDIRDEEVVHVAAKRCDVVFHQAALRSVQRSIAEPAITSDVNIRGTLSVLLAAREHGARVVFASSSSVYGEQDDYPVHEHDDARPRSPYAASKLAGEVYCAVWFRAFAVPTIALRYFNVYGPKQDPTSEYAAVVPRFAVACLTGNRPVIYGDGEQARDFTYIDDAIEANVLGARAPEGAFGRAFNISGGREPTSVNQLFSIIAELTDNRPNPMYAEPRPGDVRLSHADVSQATSFLGYRPRFSVIDGLRPTIEWFRQYLIGRASSIQSIPEP